MAKDLISIDTEIQDRVVVGQTKLTADYTFPDGLTSPLKAKVAYRAYCAADEDREFTKEVTIKNKERGWKFTYKIEGESIACELDYDDGRKLSQDSSGNPTELIYSVPRQADEKLSIEDPEHNEMAGLFFDFKGLAKRALNKVDEQITREMREHMSENPLFSANMPKELQATAHSKILRQ